MFLNFCNDINCSHGMLAVWIGKEKLVHLALFAVYTLY